MSKIVPLKSSLFLKFGEIKQIELQLGQNIINFHNKNVTGTQIMLLMEANISYTRHCVTGANPTHTPDPPYFYTWYLPMSALYNGI